MLDSCLTLALPSFIYLLIFTIAPCWLFIDLLLMTFCIGFVASFLQDHLCAFLHCDLNGVLASPFDFLDSLLLTLQHLLCFHDLAALVLRQPRIDCVVWLDGHVAATMIALVSGDYALGWRTIVNWSVGGKGHAWRRWCLSMHWLRLVLTALGVLVRCEHKLCKVCVWLGQVECLRLVLIVTTSALAF